MSLRRGPVAALLGGGLLLAGCAVPTGGTPTTIAASDVPYGLAETTPARPAAPAPEPQGDRPEVYLVTVEEALVPAGREVPPGEAGDQLSALLDQLGGGPTPDELDAGLATALPPSVVLTVGGLDGTTATVDIAGPAGAPAGQDGRLAVAQLVLTATSVPGVSAVLLTRDGNAVEAPLPSGELTTDPLTAAQYLGYVRGAPAGPS